MARRARKKFSVENVKKAEFMAVLAIVLFVGMMVSVSLFTGLDKVWQEFKKLDGYLIPLVLGLSLVNYVFRGMKWHVFATRLKLNVPFKRMAVYYLSGMAMTVTPGKLGTGLRLWFLKKCHNINYSHGLPLMIMDPITDLAALFMLCLLGAFSFAAYGLGLGVFGGVLAGLLLLFAKPKLFQLLIKGLYRLFGRRGTKGFAKTQKMVRKLSKLVNPATFSGTVGFSLIGWTASITAFWVILDAMGAPITFVQAMYVFSFATILGGATMAPGGLVGTEAAMFALLLTLDVPEPSAVAAITIIRLTTLWFGVLVGFIILPFGLSMASKSSS